MGLLQLLNHLLNFAAPAMAVAVLVALCSLFFKKKRPRAGVLWSFLAINFIAGVMALALGAWLFGVDGKMATYAALLLAVATCQWLALRGWKA